MPRYAFLVDVDKCNGCYNCFMACKDEHIGNSHFPWAEKTCNGVKLIDIVCREHGSGSKIKVDYYPVFCRQCEDPECARKLPEGAVTKTEEGVVLFKSSALKGIALSEDICPYGALAWNEELQIIQKCDFCIHLLKNGEKTTRCAESCPTGALVFGDLDDPNCELYGLLHDNNRDMSNRVKYINMTSPFIAGEVITSDNQCLSEVTVSLYHVCGNNKRLIKTEQTDFLGDFQFKYLEQGEFQLDFTKNGYKTTEQNIILNQSINLGTICLNRMEEV